MTVTFPTISFHSEISKPPRACGLKINGRISINSLGHFGNISHYFCRDWCSCKWPVGVTRGKAAAGTCGISLFYIYGGKTNKIHCFKRKKNSVKSVTILLGSITIPLRSCFLNTHARLYFQNSNFNVSKAYKEHVKL